MKRIAAVAWLVSAPWVAACSGGATLEEAAQSITEADFMAKLGVIAADSMMGRATPSEGLTKTAEWAAAEFERYGLLPGGDDGGFIQNWPYPAYALDWDATEVSVEGGVTLTLGDDLGYDGRLVESASTQSLVIVAGDTADRGQVASLDVADRHVLLFPGSPQVSQSTRFLLGAASVFVVSDLDDEAWAAAVATQRERSTRVYGGADGFDGGTPVFQIRRAAAERLLEAGGTRVAAPTGMLRVVAESDLALTVSTVVTQVDEATAPNVVAILPGSDPLLRDEYVIFSAHMDHVGVNPLRAREDSVFDASGAFERMETDSIFNGADDDASGTVGVVEVAEAFALLEEAPRRSMVFLLVSGEERGLLGSRWFSNNPTVPAEGIVANFNTDMIGRNWSDTIVVIGKEHSELGDIMNRVGAERPELGMEPIDDLWPEQNFYGRSDHFNFARRGVPVLFFFNGTHDDYHQATDEVRKVDGEKATRISKMVFYLSYEVGNLDSAPLWFDDSYDEFVSDPPPGAPRRSRAR